MQIVIDIPCGLMEDFKQEQWTALSCMEMKKALENGILLPKGHGRLIDADVLKNFFQEHAYPVRYDRNSIEQGMSMTGIKTCLEESATIVEADEDDRLELAPSEFTGIDFSEEIIITKTPTGAMATYGDKTVTTDGDFEDASRQALAEVLCPFKVGDRVQVKCVEAIGVVERIEESAQVKVVDEADGSCGWWYVNAVEPYTEPLYNAKLFCVEGYGVFKKGVVYTVENGIFIGVHNSHFRDLEDINTNLASQFMEIKGGLDD